MLNYTLVIEIEISKIYSLSIVVGIYIASNQIRMTTAANNHKARLIYIFMWRKHFIMYFPSQQVNLQFNLNIITLCYLMSILTEKHLIIRILLKNLIIILHANNFSKYIIVNEFYIGLNFN